jgi:diacylglycerol O-acyltransferase
MQRLRPDDHFLILLEGDETPMHVGSLMTLERAGTAEQLADHLIDRLPSTPLLRVLRRAPLGFDSDVWVGVDRQQIDLDHHIVIHRRRAVVSDDDLDQFVANGVMKRLDLSRPPFEFHIIDGVDGNRLAMYVKIHHSVADGIGFQTILGLLSDDVASGSEVEDVDATVPTRHEWLRQAIDRFRADGATAARRSAAKRAALEALKHPDLQRRPTPALAISGPTSTQRAFARVTLDFDELRSVAHALDATINDVFLAVAGTTMREHLMSVGELPPDPLVINGARSYRRPEHGPFGNRIVAIHPHLATHLADPIERLRAIQDSMAIERRRTVFDEALLDQRETPFGAAVRRRRFADRRASGTSILPGNITVSNVPGPSHVRTYAGMSQLSNHPTPLLGSGRALNFTARRNAGSFDVGVMCDPTKIADVKTIAGRFEQSFERYARLARKR